MFCVQIHLFISLFQLGLSEVVVRIDRWHSWTNLFPFVPFILITASLLRVHFWWGKKFDTALLLQAIDMLLAQLILLRVCMLQTSLRSRQLYLCC